MRLIDRLFSGSEPVSARGMGDFFSFNGQGYALNGGMGGGYGGGLNLTQKGETVVEPDGNLVGYANQVYQQSGPVAALVFVRQMTFSAVEFKWQSKDDRSISSTPALSPLEQPWVGGTTQNLLSKCLVDADLSGNSYWLKDGPGLSRLRPDWVEIVLDRSPSTGLHRKIGYKYYEGGKGQSSEGTYYTADEVAHFMPLQDPLNPWRGISWLTPVIREVMVDQAASTHQRKFFENAATPNLAVKLDPSMTPEKMAEFRDVMDAGHGGVDNAYKTMYLGGGADVTVVGTDLSKLDLKSVQGGLETRLAAAAGVPVTVVGFREGLSGSSLNAGNYGAARRRYADGTLHPLWMEAAGSFARVVTPPAGSRLWFDTTNVPLLREDATDEAGIIKIQTSAIRQLLDAGFDPDSAVSAVRGADISRLTGKHTGQISVQLQPMDGSGNDDGGTDDE